MESRIGHLHYRVRVARGARVPPGLEQVARERVGEALGAALDAAFGDDPAVYVLRSIRADVAVDLSARQPDRVVAERWAERLASAITRAVANEDDESVARFTDEAEFVARFATDLVDGVAWERWFYGAFAELRPLGRRRALRAVLIEHRHELSAILAWLARRGSLERVLAALDHGTLAALGQRRDEPELLRPLVAAAVRIAEAAGGPLPAGATLDELLARHVAAVGRVPSWRDRSALADGVLEALRVLVRDGTARFRPGEPAEALLERVEQVLAELDWLDLDRLRAGVAELFGGDATGRVRRDAAPRRTRRELELLAKLGGALRSGAVTLDVRHPASHANALRLRAALASRSGARAGDRGATEAIDALLAAVETLASHSVGREVWALIAAGDEPGAWRRYAAAGASAADVELLRAAPELVRALAPAGAGVSGSHADRWIDSPCAGALLPLRAAFDLRLPELAAAAGAPPPAQLLLAIALRLGRPEALEPRADAALATALGFERPPQRDELRETWAPVPAAAHVELRETLAAALETRGLTTPAGETPAGARLGRPEADETIGLATAAVLRAWAQWLRGFGDSSTPFLLEHFVRRPGRVTVADGRALVELEPRPHDLVLDLAGYLDPLEPGAHLPLPIDFTLAT